MSNLREAKLITAAIAAGAVATVVSREVFGEPVIVTRDGRASVCHCRGSVWRLILRKV